MKLSLKPNAFAFKTFYAKLAESKPLTSSEWNFLYQHQKTLSNVHFDPVLSYYLKNQNHLHEHSFLLPNEKFDSEAAKKLKKRIQILLKAKKAVNLQATPRQLRNLNAVSAKDLIFFHGNQFLTGAPFQLGGVPHTIFFQWGNLFGVAKYHILSGEKSLASNVLVRFEMLKDRQLAEAVKHYQLHHQPTNLFEHHEKHVAYQYHPVPDTRFLHEKKSK